MLIPSPAGHLDAIGQGAFGVCGSRKPGQKLPVLEIAGHVIRVVGQQLVKVLDGRGGIALRSRTRWPIRSAQRGLSGGLPGTPRAQRVAVSLSFQSWRWLGPRCQRARKRVL